MGGDISGPPNESYNKIRDSSTSLGMTTGWNCRWGQRALQQLNGTLRL